MHGAAAAALQREKSDERSAFYYKRFKIVPTNIEEIIPGRWSGEVEISWFAQRDRRVRKFVSLNIYRSETEALEGLRKFGHNLVDWSTRNVEESCLPQLRSLFDRALA